MRSSRIYVMQAVLLLAMVAVPWIGELLFVVQRSPLPGVDTTSVGFAVSGVLMTIAIHRYRLLDIVPQARAAMVDRMEDGFIVVDTARRIIDINPSARREIEIPGEKSRHVELIVSDEPVTATSHAPRLVVVRDVTARKELIAKHSSTRFSHGLCPDLVDEAEKTTT